MLAATRLSAARGLFRNRVTVSSRFSFGAFDIDSMRFGRTRKELRPSVVVTKTGLVRIGRYLSGKRDSFGKGEMRAQKSGGEEGRDQLPLDLE